CGIEWDKKRTGERLSIPCHKELRAELETMPRVADTILVGERGAPLTGSSLSVMVRRALREMGVDGYAIHGLRKNAAIELDKAITGRRTLGMVAHYSKKRDQRLHARSAMDKRERAQSGKPK